VGRNRNFRYQFNERENVGKELERRKRNLKILLSNHFKVRNVSNVGELLLVIKNTNWSKQLLLSNNNKKYIIIIIGTVTIKIITK
jgi:hypothetical protein